MVIAMEIEHRIRYLADRAEIAEPGHKSMPLQRLITELVEHKVLHPDVMPIFRDFWAIRNRIVHDYHFELSAGLLYQLADLGRKILGLLPTDIARKEPS